jgi:ABC-2 type transport system ATP-binding protein
MIEIKNVTKEYIRGGILSKRKVSRGVENLSLDISSGAYGLLGINGAGKTTTLKMIATLLRPDSGRILINGKDSIIYEKELRRSINMITGSDRMLYFRLTGLENLLYFASLYEMEPKKAKMRCMHLLDLTGLETAADKRVEEYSRGMKQRLAIARGLINDPQILLLDEPTLGLDVAIARDIRLFIKNKLMKDKERTIILTSHYMGEIEEICSNIGILQEGKLIYEGDFDGLYDQMGMEEIHRFNIPGVYKDLQKEIEALIEGESLWKCEEDGSLQLSLGSAEGYKFLKHLHTLPIKGLNYSQVKPGLEEAVLKLSSRSFQ